MQFVCTSLNFELFLQYFARLYNSLIACASCERGLCEERTTDQTFESSRKKKKDLGRKQNS